MDGRNGYSETPHFEECGLSEYGGLSKSGEELFGSSVSLPMCDVAGFMARTPAAEARFTEEPDVMVRRIHLVVTELAFKSPMRSPYVCLTPATYRGEDGSEHGGFLVSEGVLNPSTSEEGERRPTAMLFGGMDEALSQFKPHCGTFSVLPQWPCRVVVDGG